eukprot:scaffold33284_cov69-Phaeocystis_antarctica.AAC.5
MSHDGSTPFAIRLESCGIVLRESPNPLGVARCMLTILSDVKAAHCHISGGTEDCGRGVTTVKADLAVSAHAL